MLTLSINEIALIKLTYTVLGEYLTTTYFVTAMINAREKYKVVKCV